MVLVEIVLKFHVFGDKMEEYFYAWIKKPKFLDGVELPASYYQSPDPYNDASDCEISLLELSRYAQSKNKKIVDLSCEKENQRMSRTVLSIEINAMLRSMD